MCRTVAAALVAALVISFSTLPDLRAAVTPDARAGEGITLGVGSSAFRVAGFTGEEAISAPPVFLIDLAPGEALTVPFEALIGQQATLSIVLSDGLTKEVTGVIAGVTERAAESETSLRVELVARLRLLDLNRQSRLFQDSTVPEILAQVLGQHGVVNSWSVAGMFTRRPMVIQYNESDFVFLSRLMEEEGISYFFPTRGGMEIGDSASSRPSLGSLRFVSRGQKDGAVIRTWNRTQNLRPGQFSLDDRILGAPDRDLEVTALIRETTVAGSLVHLLRTPLSSSFEIYDYPGAYAQKFDGVDAQIVIDEGKRVVALRAEEAATRAVEISGASSFPLTSGHTFLLGGHPNADGEYLVTSVRHQATSDRNGKTAYANTFTCIPSSVPFRPERATPRPVVAGVQVAIVTGPPGETVFTDKLGRVKVQFHWDRSAQSDENSSAWIRVAAVERGFLPEVGDEVIVGFEEGDPDRPIILGSLFNGADTE
jgi:type VI secretion system secreted protein VgrG